MLRATSIRRPAYLGQESAQRDRWMISYTDMMTILLILFIAITAKGIEQAERTPNPPHVERVESAPPSPLLAIQDRLERSGIAASMENRGLVISLSQVILFASGEDRLNPNAAPTVHEIADAIRDLPNRVRLVGHADGRPIRNGRFRNNWELSSARSLSLLEALNRDCGIPEARLSVESMSSYDPRASDETKTGRAMNRRVEIVVLNENY